MNSPPTSPARPAAPSADLAVATGEREDDPARPAAPRAKPSESPALGRSAAPVVALLAVPALSAAAAVLAARPLAAQPPTAAADDAAEQLLEAAAERYRRAPATCADFEQVVDVRLLGRRVESAGRICQRRPNLFSMRFTDPDGDMVISDGEHFWVYYPSLDPSQVVRYAVAGSPGGYDFHREFLDDPGAKYVVRDGGADVVDGRECRIVELAPRGEAAYRRARLWLDVEDHLLRRTELHQENGSVRTLTLRNPELSPLLDGDVFAFRVPEGARVMDAPSRPARPARPGGRTP